MPKEITFDLTKQSNFYFTNAIREWCLSMTKENLAAWIKAKNLETSNSKRKRERNAKYSEVEINKHIHEMDENGNIIISKTLFVTFIFFWSKKLHWAKDLEGPHADTESLSGNENANVLKDRLKKMTAAKEALRLKVYRLEKRVQHWKSSKRTVTRKLLLFTKVTHNCRKKRLHTAKHLLMENVVGFRDENGNILSYKDRERLFENEIKPALLKIQPYKSKAKQVDCGISVINSIEGSPVSPFNCKKLFNKIPHFKRSIQEDIHATQKKMRSDFTEKCNRWYERRRNFVSWSTARKIAEAGFVDSATAKKRRVRIPKEYATETGLIVKEASASQSRDEEKEIRQFLVQNFQGEAPTVKSSTDLCCIHANAAISYGKTSR